ncbi:MAG: hypothetical protein Q9214_007508 [Letrouitia sp. 1 TL-2023]
MGNDSKPTPALEKENNNKDDPSTNEDDNQTTEPENQTTADLTQTESYPTTTKLSSSSAVQSSALSTSSDSGGYAIETAGYFEEDWFAVDTAAVSEFLATITGGIVSATAGAITSGTSTNIPSTSGSNEPTSTDDDATLSTEAPAPSSTKEPDPTTKPPDPTTTEESPPPPTVAPVDPPSQPSCYPSPSGKYQDSHEDNMQTAAGSFCNKFAKDVSHDATVDIDKTGWADADDQFWDANDYNDDVYEISIKNIDGCVPGDAGFDLGEPVTGQKCKDILVGTWTGCTGNKGRGGVTQAGCLSYSLRTVY